MQSTFIKSTGTGSASQFIQCYRSDSFSRHNLASEKYGLIELCVSGVISWLRPPPTIGDENNIFIVHEFQKERAMFKMAAGGHIGFRCPPNDTESTIYEYKNIIIQPKSTI